jgi:hypothetical protein
MRELIEYKDKIAIRLISSPEIVKLVNSSYIDNPVGLINTHIFDREYVPRKPDEANVYIGIETYIPRPVNKEIKEVGVNIVILVHEDLIRVPGRNGTRVDNLVAEIWEKLDEGHKFGIGKLKLQECLPLRPAEAPRYYGKIMEYSCNEFV